MIIIIISLIIAFIFGALLMFLVFCIVAPIKDKKPKNNVHFYVARDKNGELFLYMGKPNRYRSIFGSPLSSLFEMPCHLFNHFGLNKKDYANLKWEDEPVEVFLNMED